MGNNLDLAIGVGDLDDVAKVAGAALNLDALVQELLEGEDIEDLVASGLLSVDDELSCGAVPGQPLFLRSLFSPSSPLPCFLSTRARGRRMGICRGINAHLLGHLGGLGLLLL